MDNTEEKQVSNELIQQYANKIKEFQMKPKTRVFLISSKFLKGLESFNETNKVPKIQNSELKNAFNSMSTTSNKNKNKKKTKNSKIPQINKDFYPVDEDLWNDLVFHFGGGPEISYYVCEDGTLDLANFQINVKFQTEKKCIQTSMKTDLQTFHLLVLNAFGIDPSQKYKLCANNSPTAIPYEGTVGGRIGNEKLLILTVHDQEQTPKTKPQAPIKKTDPTPKEENKTTANEPKNESSQPLGLKNTGNSCYMNSVCQCFSSVDHLNENLNVLRREADETLATLHSLEPNSHLRGLAVKIHLSQFTTTNAFISLMSNLKNNVPVKVDDNFNWRPPRNSKGGKNKKYNKYMNRQMKSFSTAKIQTAIHIKKSMSFFANNQQQDAHEFFSFLLDAVHDECPKTIERLFYGKCKRTTTCALCGHQSVNIESFSSLSLPVANSRKVLYSPFDLNKPLQRIQSIPDNLSNRVVLIGKTRNGNKVVSKMSPDFIEVIALEIPDLSDANQNPTSNETEDAIISHANTHDKFENIDNMDGNDSENNDESENEDNNNNNTNDDNNNNNESGNNNNETNNNDTNDENKVNNNDNENDNTNDENNNDNTNDENKDSNNDDNNKEVNENNSNANNDNNTNSEYKEVNDNDSNASNDNNNNNDGGDSGNANDGSTNDEKGSECGAFGCKGDVEYGVALLRVINKKTNEKTLPILVKVPLNVQVTEEQIRGIVAERLRPILQQPDAEVKLVAPPKVFAKDGDNPLCRFPLSCHVTSPLKPTRLETLFTKSEIPISVDELLESFFSKMQLDEDNMWLCEVCKNNSCAYQQVTLLDTPAQPGSREASEEKDDQRDEAAATGEANQEATSEKTNNQQAEAANASEADKEINNQQADAAAASEANQEATSEGTSNQQAESAAASEANQEATSNQQAESAAASEVGKETTSEQQSEAKCVENNEAGNQQAEESKEPSDQRNEESKDAGQSASDKQAGENSEAQQPPAPSAQPFHLPECLVLQLKRFISKNGRLAKDPTTVIIPHYINIGQYIEFTKPNEASQSDDHQENQPESSQTADTETETDATDATNDEEKTQTEADRRYAYKLVAVSNHAGSLNGGHYTAYGERRGEWFTFNDAHVSPNRNIFNDKSNGRFGSSNAYLLFYSKVEM